LLDPKLVGPGSTLIYVGAYDLITLYIIIAIYVNRIHLVIF